MFTMKSQIEMEKYRLARSEIRETLYIVRWGAGRALATRTHDLEKANRIALRLIDEGRLFVSMRKSH
jgi:hypothetical protein